MGTVESNGGSKFIAGLKTKKNREELNNVLNKYSIAGQRPNRNEVPGDEFAAE